MRLSQFIHQWPPIVLELAGGTPLVFLPDVRVSEGIELERRLECRPGFLRLSCRLANRRSTPVLLRSARVFAATEEGQFTDTPFPEWRVDRLGRNKNDIPGRFQPSRDDRRLREALLDTSEVPAGHGLRGVGILDATAQAGAAFYADPGLVLLDAPGAPALFLGFDGQDRHLNRICLETTSDRQHLKCLTAEAELDGIRLAPGESRPLHDFLLEAADSADTLLERHAERVRARLGSRFAPFRNIYCTWYYYGPAIHRAEVLQNVDYIRCAGLPFDAFQIDSGWFRAYGDWEADPAKFPNGMAEIADAIQTAGLRPGIWTAPFVLASDSPEVARHPDLALRKSDGTPCRFVCDGGACLVLDPYSPSAPEYLERLYGRLREWGFTYHKLDFLRAVFIQPEARFHQPDRTRGEAYRHAMTLIRSAVGENAVINACGGLYEGTAGLAEIVRSSADLVGFWDRPDSPVENTTTRIRQNLFRRFYNRLWTSDPDALQLRRNATPAPDLHSLGLFTDDEAFSTCVNQLLGGGLLTVSENFPKLDPDRLLLLRLLMPFVPAQCMVLDADDRHYLPERLLLQFEEPWHGSARPRSWFRTPEARGIPRFAKPWHGATKAVALLNWNHDAPRRIAFRLRDVPGLPPRRAWRLCELRLGRILRVPDADTPVSATVPGHGARVFLIRP